VVALFIRRSLGRPCAGPPSVTLPRRKLATLAGDRRGWEVAGEWCATGSQDHRGDIYHRTGPAAPVAGGTGVALWALAMLGLAVVPWIERLTIRAGRPDLTRGQGPLFVAVLGHLTATTVGAVLASRRPRHPVGWLLLGFALSLTASGVIASSVAYGLLARPGARPGALPAAHALARYYPATGPAALALLSLVLLLTRPGRCPRPAGAGGRSSPQPPPLPWSWWWRWRPDGSTRGCW
jgi:hypothetical protein